MNKNPELLYHVKLENPNSHLLDITITIKNNQKDLVLATMPTWRPGRYFLMDYAKDISLVNVKNQKNEEINFHKIDKTTWEIEANNNNTIIINYKYYANTLDAGSTLWNGEQLYITGITCFMYIEDRKNEEIELTIESTETDINGWKCATTCPTQYNNPDNKIWKFNPKDYDELVDNPFILSDNIIEDTFKIDKTNFSIFYQGFGNYPREKIIEETKKIVDTQIKTMDVMPCEKYAFLYQIIPHNFKHGVEHKDNNVIVFGPAFKFDDEEFYDIFMSITSHEFFHLWNVKRIKPDVLVPFNYKEVFYTPLFFIAEGFTCYYGNLSLARSKVWDKKKYFESFAKDLTFEEKIYGRNITSLAMSSWDSWISYYQNSNPNQNISFYLTGGLVAFMLDIEIRKNTQNKHNLDNVMQILYKDFAEKNKGYSVDDFISICENISKIDLKDFFNKYLYSTTPLDYNRYFDYLGLSLEKEENPKEEALERLGIKFERNKFGIIGKVHPKSEAYEAGIQKGDVLVAVNDHKIDNDNLKQIMDHYINDDTIKISVFRNSMLKNIECTYKNKFSWKYVIKEKNNITEEQKNNLKNWLWY